MLGVRSALVQDENAGSLYRGLAAGKQASRLGLETDNVTKGHAPTKRAFGTTIISKDAVTGSKGTSNQPARRALGDITNKAGPPPSLAASAQLKAGARPALTQSKPALKQQPVQGPAVSIAVQSKPTACNTTHWGSVEKPAGMTWLQQEQHREAKENAGIHSRVAKMVSSIAAAAAPSCNLLICGSPPDSGSDAEDAIHITVPQYVLDSDTKYSFPESLSFTMPCLADCLPTMAVDDCDLELDFDELI